MNQLNEDERLLAEIDVGRPLIEENTFNPARARHRAGQACPRGWRVCGRQKRFAASRSRCEPYALASASTDLCGGIRRLVSLPRQTARIAWRE